MSHRIRALWRTLAGGFESIEGVEPVTEASLDAIEKKIRKKLREFRALAGRPFALPADLRAFYLVAQDQLRRTHRLGEDPLTFYAVEWLPTDGLALADEAGGDSTPWLEIAAFGDQHWVFVCCDPEDPLFGSLVERRDSTPWSQTVHDEEVHPDLEAFLRSLTA
ncbi:MAG: hypothetical protein H6737_22665 [Alphaproteobacteria bacterium]|nr:hypothetical protein [Alphaproteobacteria bacterium]